MANYCLEPDEVEIIHEVMRGTENHGHSYAMRTVDEKGDPMGAYDLMVNWVTHTTPETPVYVVQFLTPSSHTHNFVHKWVTKDCSTEHLLALLDKNPNTFGLTTDGVGFYQTMQSGMSKTQASHSKSTMALN